MTIEEDLDYVEGLLNDHRGYAPDSFYRIKQEIERLRAENAELRWDAWYEVQDE